MIVDQFTFGKSQASITLAKLLEEEDDSNVMRAVSQILTQSNSVNKLIMQVDTHRGRMYLMMLHRRDVKTRIAESTVFPTRIQTYLANVAIGHMKEAMRYSND